MLLMASRRATLSVVTNKPLAPSRRILEALDLLSFFDAVIGGDGPHGRKPAATGLRAVAGATEHVVLVGDSPIDWQTAVAAGSEFVWARYGFGAQRFAAPPDTPFVIDRPSELAAIIERTRAIRSG
jgi:phosphoglycolate phosphatase